MKKLKSKVIYHSGSIPVPGYLQKGYIELKDGMFRFVAKGKSEKYNIHITVPATHIIAATAQERKYYSSMGYFVIITYKDHTGKTEEIELEIRSFVRRLRAQYFSRLWAETLSNLTD